MLTYFSFWSYWIRFQLDADTFASLAGIFIAITISVMLLNIYVINAGTKKHISIIQKKKNKHDKTELLAKSKLNRVEVLISKGINPNISHGEFVLMYNMLKRFYNMKEEIGNSNNKQKFRLYIKQTYLIV